MRASLWKRFFGDFGAIALFFLAISIFLLAFAVQESMGRLEDHLRQRHRQSLETSLDGLIAEMDEEYRLSQEIIPFLALVRRMGLKPTEPRPADGARPRAEGPQKAFVDLTRNLGQECTIYIYREGKPLGSFPESAPDRAFYASFLTATRMPPDLQAEAEKKIQADLFRIFGKGNLLENMQHWEGRWHSFDTDPGTRFLFTSCPDGYQFMVVVKPGPSPEERFRLRQFLREGEAGMAVPPRKTWIPPAGVASEAMELAWTRSRIEGSEFVRSSGRNWLFCRQPDGRLWCRTSTGGWGEAEAWLGRVTDAGYALGGLLLALFFLKAAGVAWVARLVGPLNRFSLRIQLYALFLLASLVPLGAALLIGVVTMLDRQEVLRTGTMANSRQVILGLEQSFLDCLVDFRRLSSRLRDSAAQRLNAGGSPAGQILPLLRENLVQRVDLRDRTGKPLFTTTVPSQDESGFFIETFTRLALRRHGGVGDDLSQERISPQDVFAEAFISSLDPGLFLPLREPSRAWAFKQGADRPGMIFWDLYPETATGPAFFLVLNRLHRMYERRLRTTTAAETAVDTAFSGFIETFDHGNLEWTRPTLTGPDRDALVRACIRSQVTRETLFREVELAGGRYLATIKPETYLTDRAFFHLVPLETTMQTITALRWRLAATACLALLVAWFAARLLTTLFVRPIAALSEGIGAIRDRRIEHRIPAGREDEFGVVISAFNRLLGGMKELQFARIVQESLLPAQAPPIEGYEIAWLRFPATDLAGDYHDLFPLPDGRLVVLIGDVTGHGVSAALAMAMAKATIDYQGVRGWEFPGEVLDHLNSLFFTELRARNKLMSMGCAVLDPRNHRVIYENAGHPFPMIFRHATGQTEEPRFGSFPLGSREKRRANAQTIPLARGDALLMMTDGFPECPDGEGKPFEYQRVAKLLETLMREGLPAEAALGRMMADLDAFRVPGPYPDDITLILFVRRD